LTDAMRALLASERRGQAAVSTFLVGAIALVALLVVEQRGLHRVLPAVACLVGLVMWSEPLTRWRNLLAGLFLVILFIPMARYTLPGNLPFQLEPYRVIVAGLALVWVVSLLADRRVKLRRTGFDVPLMLVLLTAFLSDIANPSRVRSLSSEVLKGETFLLSFFIVLYIVVSLVRTRADFRFLVKLLAAGGGVVAVFSIIERRVGYNVFNHLSSIFPFLQFNGQDEQFREGRLRVLASSQHPIALSVLFVILLPLVLYLARREGRRWMIVAGLYVIAIFSTASRTGIIGLLVLCIVYLCLQPRTVLRAWPLAVPVLAAVHVAAPGAIGTLRALFNPTTLVSQQTEVTVGNDAYGSGRLTDLRPSLGEWSNKPLLGVGYATRIVTGLRANARILDDQWLGTLLETGYLGFLAWIWLFVRSVRRLIRAASAEGDTDDGWLLTGLTGAILAFAVTMAFYDAFSFIQNVFVCFILFGLSAALLNLKSTEATATEENRRLSGDSELSTRSPHPTPA
jgi:polysaccharide biosynthesis protein PslJ